MHVGVHSITTVVDKLTHKHGKKIRKKYTKMALEAFFGDGIFCKYFLLSFLYILNF